MARRDSLRSLQDDSLVECDDERDQRLEWHADAVALARLGELAKQVPAKTDKPAEPKPEPAPAAKADAADVNESLAKLAESFRSLSETVKEQQQRLGRVEKQFGLPNSAAPAERVSKATVEDVGWPLDLNKPKDRESVDKAISFHDL